MAKGLALALAAAERGTNTIAAAVDLKGAVVVEETSRQHTRAGLVIEMTTTTTTTGASIRVRAARITMSRRSAVADPTNTAVAAGAGTGGIAAGIITGTIAGSAAEIKNDVGAVAETAIGAAVVVEIWIRGGVVKEVP